MSLYSISGTDCNCGNDCGCGYIGGRRKRAARKAKRQARRARRKARKTGINCKGAKVKAVVLAPARNAYLLLVRLNVKKLAVKLHAATSTTEGRKAVHGKWCKLGGNGAKLQSAIDKAYNKYKRKRGIIGYMDADDMGQIGLTVAAALAAAKPIIAALKPLLKKFIAKKKGGSDTAEDIEQAVKELAPQRESEPEQTYQNDEIGAIGVNPWLIGAGALAAYYLLKKKK